MLRSPFLFLLSFLFFCSCKEETISPIKPNTLKEEATELREKALAALQYKKYNSSFYYFNKSKILFESVKDSANITFNCIQMAQIQQVNGDYYGSKETLTEALPFSKTTNDYSAAITNLFGIADKELSLYEDAILYYDQAVKDAKDPLSKQSPLNNIAVVYIKQKKYNKAIAILEGILNKKIAYDTPYLKSKARVMDNLGFAYFKNRQNEKALPFLTNALALRQELDDRYGSIQSYLHLADYYAKTDLEKSNNFAADAYKVATQLNSVDERLEALSFLISNTSSVKNTPYAQKYILINDSIINIRNNFKNKFAKIKYDSKKEKDENQKLRLERAENQLSLQEAKYQKIVSFLGIVFLVIVIVILVRYYRNKGRIQEIKVAYNTEIRIAKDIHDELANDVFHAITYTQTQSLARDNIKENLIQKLDNIYSRVRGISRENNTVDIGENYARNLKEMLSTYNTKNTNVIINGIEKVNWDSTDELKKVAIHRLLQELMVNMKKHSQAALVVLKFDNTTKYIVIDYVDNGIGCNPKKINKNGLQNMENRILAIRGTVIFDTEPDKGFKVKITLPK
ncbi:ATP-binding protein [Flavobacterium sp. IR1]|nr:ATP-binding protein [Flavobacterium sp. IR1]